MDDKLTTKTAKFTSLKNLYIYDIYMCMHICSTYLCVCVCMYMCYMCVTTWHVLCTCSDASLSSSFTTPTTTGLYAAHHIIRMRVMWQAKNVEIPILAKLYYNT